MAKASATARAKRPLTVAALATERTGAPRYDRRLSDKILAAFNHAYASGAVQTATRLKAVLAEVETSERDRHERRTCSAMTQADLWIAFVEARNGYNALAAGKGVAPARLDDALARMKDAYRLWSEAA